MGSRSLKIGRMTKYMTVITAVLIKGNGFFFYINVRNSEAFHVFLPAITENNHGVFQLS
jgi:hypothetical protein